MNTYDVLIIGAGPAGCSAALTLRSRGLSPLLAYTTDGALALAKQVDNYPGARGLSGREMLEKFRLEAQEAGAALCQARVTTLLPMGRTFSAAVDNDILSVRALILTSGAVRGKALENEDALLGRGVSYCATCDGMFYKGRAVAVVGADEEAVREANFLATLASHVYYISEKPHDLSALEGAVERVAGKPLAVLGEEQAAGVRTDQGDVASDGVFILRPTVAPSRLLTSLKTEKNAVWHDAAMRTSVPLVYVAGDAAGAPYQIAKAVGEGNIAALSLAQDIAQKT